jgi:hypothetical protein
MAQRDSKALLSNGGRFENHLNDRLMKMKKNRQTTKSCYALKVRKHGPTMSIHDSIEQAAEALKEDIALWGFQGSQVWIWKVDGEEITELSEPEQAIAMAAWVAGEDIKRSRATTDFISSLNRVLAATGAKPLDDQQVTALVAAQYFGGTTIPVVQLNTPAPRRHGLQRTNRQDIMVERYIYKDCEIEIYQNARSIDTDRLTYFAIPALPYGKTGKKFTRRGLDDSESVEEAKRSAEIHVDQWEAKQAP